MSGASTFAALQARLAAGKASSKSFKNKTPWSKGAKRVGKGTLAVSGATPGDLKKRGV
jgi:hypothetical protein